MDTIKDYIIPFKISHSSVADGSISRGWTLLIRVLCCLLVGLHHFSRIQVEQNGSHNPIYILLASQGGNVGVGMFFFLSGYGLMETSKKYHLTFKEIINKRFWRLIWPILVINIAYFCICGMIGADIETSHEKWLMRVIDFADTDAVLWFMNVLFVCYTIFYVSESISSLRTRILVRYGLGLCFIIYMMATRYDLHWHYTNIPMFFLGVLYSQYRQRISRKLKLKILIPILTIIIILTAAGWFMFHMMWARFGVCLITLGMFLWVIGRCQIETKINSPIYDSSYEYYLIHNKILMIWGGGKFTRVPDFGDCIVGNDTLPNVSQ